MLGDEAQKDILKDDYERRRARAEKARDRGDTDKAADHYRTCTNLLRKMADLESSETVASEQRNLANNLQEAAETLSNRDDSASGRRAEPLSGSGAREDTPRQIHEENEEVDANEYLQDPPKMDFDGVGGMSELKQTLTDKVIDPLERPELYEKYDLGVVNGILLYGPPGTGKTYITKALAGKLGYNFIDVTPSDLTSSLVGQAADNVADLFEVARDNQPCLVFIDEIDGVASARSGGAQKTQSERQMVNQLLEELTEIQSEDVVVVGATNLLSEVDDAIKRSGRFDERIEVPPPDATAREAILRVHLRDRPVLTEEIEFDRVRELTEGYSASDMELIATNAARQALQQARDQDEIQPVTQAHVEAAIEDAESSLDSLEG
jgi:transitional endoplasmic reticulum ATPase